jgi:hypothetical protein
MLTQSYVTSWFCRMQEADSGFVLVVDRRNDKWHSVKTVLLKISVGIWKQCLCVHFVDLMHIILFVYIASNSDCVVSDYWMIMNRKDWSGGHAVVA